MEPVRFLHRLPAAEEYENLRRDAGWLIPPRRMIEAALPRSLGSVCAETEDGSLVGMGRVVGDGGIHFIVVDLIVRKDWQGRGIGRRLMAMLTECVGAQAVHESFIGLFAAKGREGFYEQFGFVVRPNAKLGAGMVLRLPKTP